MISYIFGMTIGSLAIITGLIFVLIYFRKNSAHKRKIKSIGTKAEVKINSDLSAWAKQTKNLFMSSSFFKYNDNKMFEVDSILVTTKAIIIVEIKSINGIIKGDSREMTWNKILGENKFQITNPIIQNEKHLDHFVKMTNVKVPTISLIIFSNRAKYIDISNVPSHVAVTKHSEIFDVLDDIDSSLPIALSEYEMRTIYGTLKFFKTNAKKDLKMHKKFTRQVK